MYASLTRNEGLHLLYGPQRRPLQRKQDETGNVLTMHEFITKELINQSMNYCGTDSTWPKIVNKNIEVNGI